MPLSPCAAANSAHAGKNSGRPVHTVSSFHPQICRTPLLVGVLTAGIVIVVCAVSVAAGYSSTVKLSTGKKPFTTPLGFVATAPRQAGLVKPVESPVLADAAFQFTFQPKTGQIPESISSVLDALPKTNTTLNLASILGGYPETPASRSHHLNESGDLIVHTAKDLKHSKPLLPVAANQNCPASANEN